MNILFIHQNFPGQFKHLAPALAARGDQVVVLTPKVKEPAKWRGINVLPYAVKGGSTPGIHPWLVDFETKILRGTACYDAALALKERGFTPDIIVAHHGWGESLFLKDVWPTARLGLYCELYHRSGGSDTNFDPEFPSHTPAYDALRLRLKNLNNRLHEEVMDAGLSPTQFQAGTFPEHYRDRITVCHDGIDTDVVTENPGARLDIAGGPTLTPDSEVITFINRNLEPYRGYHIFMRALPELLRRRPNAQVVILGGSDTSYGAKPKNGKTWKQTFFDEVSPQIAEKDWVRVHYLGRVPYETFLSVLQVSSVHVYLTYPFVLSWSLLEAMSTKCAIVASDTAPVHEVVLNGETGVLVDFFDASAIAEATCGLLDAPERRDMLGNNARRFVRDRFDLKRVCLPRQLGWVDDLLERRPVRQPMD
ncbi:glycosyltransferase family 4 protein [Marivita hallyeonensis]|uniref:Glycosyltransferase involved in cell wall bisynthesis n=1 Tax=Marivita hallyeonensis TaxID=996342 RepID=A0A1M5M420_9RHOB|nr:glycosyltransferase family 4 protein [Marivita hallyeonensis]SHG72047.1 Glycosyltransferase involved in cell wall bisynthesis [Marivita hallyeonensis]